MKQELEQMSIVIVGHVDHGKSTVIGRLLADTGSLPEGKLEQIKRQCERNAKPFEYAFLLDALKDEQAQGITIDTARCFFKTDQRHYIIIDAPGHSEFLKNMITGAARAEAALLVIDAQEGVQENSRRHGFMLSLLGITQVVVLVNKMDLVDYSQPRFEAISQEYGAFLQQIKVRPLTFIPISAREGENLVRPATRMPWYRGATVLAVVDGLEKEKPKEDQPLRLPVQDIYKFTEAGDDRRIVAGTVETGTVRVGDEVIFLPSQKKSTVQKIEAFHEAPRREIGAGFATGLTLTTQIYIRPGELMCRTDQDLPLVSNTFRANLFWLGRQPMVSGQRYKLKLATQRAGVDLKQIVTVLDSAQLTADCHKDRIERHEVAECILQTVKPIAFDLSRAIAATGRFVVIDRYEIVGGGIITESLVNDSMVREPVARREIFWESGTISSAKRAARYNQQAKLIVITGGAASFQSKVAKSLEADLFEQGHNVYYLTTAHLLRDLASDRWDHEAEREENIRRLGELAHCFTDAGLILITNIPGLAPFEVETLQVLNRPHEVLVFDLEELTTNRGCGNDEPDRAALLAEIKKSLYHEAILLEYYL